MGKINEANQLETSKVIAHKSRKIKLPPLPWVLFVITAVALIIVAILFIRFKNIRLSSPAGQNAVCNDAVMKEFYDLTDGDSSRSEGADAKYKNFYEKISSQNGNESDVNCLYIKIRYLSDTNEFDKAYFLIDDLERLYSEGQGINAKYSIIKSARELKREVGYLRGLEFSLDDESVQ